MTSPFEHEYDNHLYTDAFFIVTQVYHFTIVIIDAKQMTIFVKTFDWKQQTEKNIHIVFMLSCGLYLDNIFNSTVLKNIYSINVIRYFSAARG